MKNLHFDIRLYIQTYGGFRKGGLAGLGLSLHNGYMQADVIYGRENFKEVNGLVFKQNRIVGLIICMLFIMVVFPVPAKADAYKYIVFIGPVGGGNVENMKISSTESKSLTLSGVQRMPASGIVQEPCEAVMGNDLSAVGEVVRDFCNLVDIQKLREKAKNKGLITGIVQSGAEIDSTLIVTPDNYPTMVVYIKSGKFTADAGQIYAIVNSTATLQSSPVNSPAKAAATGQASNSTISLKVNGQLINSDVAPVVINGRTMVPVRAIAEALGLSVSFDDATQTVTAQKEVTTVKLVIDGKANKNGQEIPLDVPAQIINGRTVAPVRFIAEAFGASVSWDEATRTVSIAK